MGFHRLKRNFFPWCLVLLGTGIYTLAALSANQWDPMAFVMVGGQFDGRVDNTSMGYDGQFIFQIARDPLNGWQYVDIPAYRYQRILYPVLAGGISLGSEAALPWLLILINLISVTAGTWVMEKMLTAHGLSRWYALGYGFFAGLWMGLRLDLTEPLAFLLVLAGLWAFESKQWGWSAVLFAGASLTREVTLAFAAGCAFSLLANRQVRLGLVWGGAVVLPFAAWQAVLWQWFGTIGVRSGGALSTPIEWIPFHGWWGFAELNPQAFWVMSLLIVPVAVIPAIAAVWTAGRGLWQGQRSEAVWILFLNGLLVAILPRSILLDPLGLIRTLVGLVTAALYFGLRKPSARALNYSLLWLLLLVFVVVDGFMPKYP
jgi:hypothetical protein